MARQEPHVKKRSLRKRNMTLWHKHCCRGKWATPEEFEEACNAYFDQANENEEPFTLSGLYLFLDISSQGFNDQSAKGVEWARVVDRAKRVVENYCEKALVSATSFNGAKFTLINRWRKEWQDKIQAELTGRDGDALSFVMNFKDDPEE